MGIRSWALKRLFVLVSNAKPYDDILICRWIAYSSSSALVFRELPHLNGLDAGEQIKAKMPKVKLVFLTLNSGAEVAAESVSPSRRWSSAIKTRATGFRIMLSLIRSSTSYAYVPRLISNSAHCRACRQDDSA